MIVVMSFLLRDQLPLIARMVTCVNLINTSVTAIPERCLTRFDEAQKLLTLVIRYLTDYILGFEVWEAVFFVYLPRN